MGDFNEVRSEHERFGSLFNVQGANAFNYFISMASLIDLPLDEGFEKLVEDTWLNSNIEEPNGMIKFKRKLQALKYTIKHWSRNANSSSFKAKVTIQIKLSDTDKVLDQGGSNEKILNTRSTLLKEHNGINSVDSLEKAQNDKIRWAIEGDESFKYFHGIRILNNKRSQMAIPKRKARAPPAAPPPPSSQVTAYQLVVQWPPGVHTGDPGVYCQIKPVPTEFKIHGLWPQPTGAPSTEAFHPNKIATLSSELSKNWPNLASADQSGIHLKFWEHEWTEHGKYSGLGVREYFEKSLELFKAVGQGLKGKLVAEKIAPTIYKTYKLQAIEAALKKINGGFSCTVICNTRKTWKKDKQIKEIRFRFTRDFKMQNNNVPCSTCGTATTDVMFPLMENE